MRLICPETRLPLIQEGDRLVTSDGTKSYSLVDGIPNLVFPFTLAVDDLRSQRFYDLVAPFYASLERLGARHLLGFDIEVGWSEVAEHIPLAQGKCILEVSPGPGIYQSELASRVGPSGRMVAVDVSRQMLVQCRRTCVAQSPQPTLVQANASHLPFEDGSFDGLFHFGGVNLFGQPEVALAEFARVTKPGGWIVYGDEHFSDEWRARTDWRKKLLMRMNPGYSRPLPQNPQQLSLLKEVSVLAGLGYLRMCTRQETNVPGAA